MKSAKGEDPRSNHVLLKKPSVSYKDVRQGKTKFWFSKRFTVAMLMFFGTVHLVFIKANLNIAIVAMTSNRTTTLHNVTIVEKAEFDWDAKTKGFVLGAFSYGFIISLLCSHLTFTIGGSRMIATATSIGGLLVLLSPHIIRYNFYLFIAIRILEGGAEGLAFLNYSEMWAKWTPLQDRTKLMSIGFSGFHVGTIIAYPICGYSIHMFGWPAAFYVAGCSTLIWSLLWFIFVPNDPSSDRWISKEELRYIKENKVIGKRPKNLLLVWKNILTSKCVWTLWICKFAYYMGKNFIETSLPMYIKDVENVDIQTIGLLSALPNILNVVVLPLLGYWVDMLQNKKILTPTQVHKTFMSTGYIISGILLISIGIFHFGFTSTMACFMVFAMVLSLNYLLLQMGCICLAPQCASVLATFITIAFSLASMIGPMIVGFVVTDHIAEEWNLCLSYTGILLLISALIFILYGSADPQPWSYEIEVDQDQPKCTRF